ncbi:MAG: hypothetical protein NT005_01455 [Spirochaetes bacterium]|nr:hypothetical protein [Spirochaetota bacterium]
MKKIALLAVFLLAIGLVAGVAEDKPLTLSGSVDLSIGDDDVKLAPGAAFSPGKTGVVATLKIGSASDKVEAGITIDLAQAITKTSAVDGYQDYQDTAYTGNGYAYLQNLADWAYYKVNAAANTYVDDTGAKVALSTLFTFDAETWDAANEDIITKTGPWTVIDVGDLTDAQKTATLSTEIGLTFGVAMTDWDTFWTAADTALTAFAFDSNNEPIVLESADAKALAAAHAMKDLWTDWRDGVFGEPTDDSWANSFPIKNAYLKLNKVLGVVDIMGEIEGRAVGVGSMVVSDKNNTTGNDANFGASLALSEGVVSGLTASVLVTGSDPDMAAAVSQDYETTIDDVAAAVEPIWGGQIDIGYATKMFGATVQFGVVDLKDFAAWQASIQPFVSLADIAGLSLKGEFNLIGGATMAMAAGASLGASIMGISPSVGFYWKDKNFGGDDSYTTGGGPDSITGDSGLMTEFNSTDDTAATALAIAASVDLAKLISMKLVTLSGGYDMLLSGSKDAGWNAGVALDFAEVLKMPVTLSFNISQWAAEALLWSGVLGYTYDKLGVTFTLGQTDTDVIGWALAGKISF